MAKSLFDLLVRHRDSLLYQLAAQEESLAGLNEETARAAGRILQTKADIDEANRALEVLFADEEEVIEDCGDDSACDEPRCPSYRKYEEADDAPVS